MSARTKQDSHSDLASLFAAIEKINHRLDRLEGGDKGLSAETMVIHPSLDKFPVAEAVADSIFSHYKKEKACQFEPDRPCDHCSMCNSRGF